MENFNCSCGSVIDKNSSFCPFCGKKVEIPLLLNVCSNCKADLPPDAKFCSRCGSNQEPQIQEVTTPQQNLEQPPVLSENENDQTDNNILSDLLPNENIETGATTDLNNEQFDNYQQNADEQVNAVADTGATTDLSDEEYNQYQMQPQAETIYEPPVEQPQVLGETPLISQSQSNENDSDFEDENALVQVENKSGQGIKFLKAFISVLLSFIIFVLALGTQLIFIVRTTLNEENIKTAVNEIDISELQMPKVVIEQTNREGFEISDDQTVAEYILAITDPDLIDDHDITTKKVEKFLNESVVKDFLANNIYLFADDILNETDEGGVSKKEITNFIKKNSSKFEKTIGYSISDNDIDKISNFLDEDNVLDKISPSYLRDEAPKQMGVIKFLFSYLFIILLCLLILLSIIAIFVINKKKIDSVFYYVGSSAMFCGAVALILGIFSNTVNNIIKPYVKELFTIIKPVTEIVHSQLIFISLVTLGVGIIFIVISILISKFSKNKV